MKHRKKGRILKRESAQRDALMRSLARSIILHGKVVTTEARAKAVRPYVERLISREQKTGLAGHRHVAALLGKDTAQHLRSDILPKLKARPGGFLRITKYAIRKGDAARLSMISFVD